MVISQTRKNHPKIEKSYRRFKFHNFDHRFGRFGLPKWSSRCVESIQLAICDKSMSRKCVFQKNYSESYGPEKSGARNFVPKSFKQSPKSAYFLHFVRGWLSQILRFSLCFETKSFLRCSDLFEMLDFKCKANPIVNCVESRRFFMLNFILIFFEQMKNNNLT